MRIIEPWTETFVTFFRNVKTLYEKMGESKTPESFRAVLQVSSAVRASLSFLLLWLFPTVADSAHCFFFFGTQTSLPLSDISRLFTLHSISFLSTVKVINHFSSVRGLISFVFAFDLKMFTLLLNKCQETLSCACEQAGWAKFAADTFKGKQRLAEGDILYALFMIFTEGKVC